MRHISLVVVALLAAVPAYSQIVTRDEAQITSVTPIVDQVRQRGRCHSIQNNQSQTGNVGQAIIGAIVGGAVGSQFGSGSGRDAMIAAGAATGAVWGSGQPTNNGTVTECEPDSVNERIRGYRVTYTYQGYTGTTVMQQPPAGPTVRVTITVNVDTQSNNFQQQQQQPPVRW